MVMADRDHVTEVLVNLLDNADKYSPPTSDIHVEIRPTETEVVVSVLDSGPGLRVADLERIFEKFYRAEAGDSQRAYGYGLGLYVCRLLTEAQGGRIWAANRPEGGSNFSLALPVARP
jgi:K+-sensing histidine kinase KdpD